MLCLKCKSPINEQSHYGLHTDCFKTWFKIADTAEFTSLQRRSSSSGHPNNITSENTSFFHGKFKKYSAELNNHSYILKMRQNEAPEIPEVEYLCNQIGEHLEIPVAEFYLIDFNDEKTFVTKNFIKEGSFSNLQHLYHFRSDDKHNCAGIIQIIREKTQSPSDVKTFIKTILYDALIGNHDRHGRNLAFIDTSRGMILSPIYDNVSYLSLETGNMLKADFNPTGRIGTSETLEPSISDYVKELMKLGYIENVINFYECVNINSLNQLIENSYCSLLMRQAIKTLINKRFEELKNAIAP